MIAAKVYMVDGFKSLWVFDICQCHQSMNIKLPAAAVIAEPYALISVFVWSGF